MKLAQAIATVESQQPQPPQLTSAEIESQQLDGNDEESTNNDTDDQDSADQGADADTEGQQTPPVGSGSDPEDATADQDPTAALEATQELDASAQQVQITEQQLSREEGAAQQLEQLQQAVGDVMRTDGRIDGPSATMVKTTLESIYRHLGMEAPAIPSNEAYEGRFTGVKAASMVVQTMESAKQNLFEKILSSLKNLFMGFLNFIGSLFKSRAALQRMMESALKRAEAIPVRHRLENKKLSGRFVRGICSAGFADAVTARAMVSSAESLTESYKQAIDHGIKLRGWGGFGDIPKLSVFNYQRFPYAVVRHEGESLPAFLNLANGTSILHLSYGVKYVSNIPAGKEIPETAPALTKDQIIDLLSASLGVMKNFRDQENRTNTFTDAVKNIFRKMEVSLQQLKAAAGNDDAKSKYANMALSQRLRVILTQQVTRWPSLVFSSLRHVFEYCVRSINNIH